MIEYNWEQMIERAPKLNKLSDKLNAHFIAVENRLADIKLGIAGYFKLDDLTYFCYERANGKWGLYIREMKDKDVYIFYSITQVPRSTRIECYELIPKLLDVITKNADKMTEKLNKTLEIEEIKND